MHFLKLCNQNFSMHLNTLQVHGAQFTQIQLHCKNFKNEYLIAIKCNSNVFDPNSGYKHVECLTLKMLKRLLSSVFAEMSLLILPLLPH